MKLHAEKINAQELKTPLLVQGCLEEKAPGGIWNDLEKTFRDSVEEVKKEEGYEAKTLKSFSMHAAGSGAKRLMCLGLGQEKDLELDHIRQAGAMAAQKAKALKLASMSVDVASFHIGETKVADITQAFAEGVLLALYEFSTYKKDPEELKLKEVRFITTDGRLTAQCKKGIEIAQAMAKGVAFARDLVNAPGHEIYPKTLMQKAQSLTKGVGTLSCKVMDKKELKEMGAGGILGVAQGSIHEPYLVHLTYKPKKKAKKRIALVGKAVTFDSGGLSIKPAQYMETMKCDMAGSAAVIGAFAAIADLAPNVEVHGIFGAAENMPSGEAIRPGDVLKAMNGKSIEVLNTDAEGRLTLADALGYAVKQKPDMMIDLATLTGACVVALGEEITAVMGNDQKLADKILEASKETGEKMWQMPLEKNYKKLLKSEIADIKNIGGRYGGALTAGLFLEEFVEDVPWVHLDIAGPAFAERPINAYMPKGATGHPVRTLLAFLRSF